MWHSYNLDILKPYVRLVALPDWQVAKAQKFTDEVILEKLKEKGHKKDHSKEAKRWFTGRLGEMAVERVLSKKFCDWSIGQSQKYDEPDLLPLGYKVGIKTVEFGKYPVIFKKSKYPEIICILLAENLVAVCGLADVETLTKYQDIELIESPLLKEKGTKTGFYGFKDLKPLDLSALEKYKIN